uniref:Uncharacterized protein n=1 Tax=Pipistrellus kuhlii TaxID=59472 RepID=A0A7J7TVZ6_PIPKU|nr:hypothetical protein mPipKuh1_009243 [Pipistrellus kuhlii]
MLELPSPTCVLPPLPSPPLPSPPLPSPLGMWVPGDVGAGGPWDWWPGQMWELPSGCPSPRASSLPQRDSWRMTGEGSRPAQRPLGQTDIWVGRLGCDTHDTKTPPPAAVCRGTNICTHSEGASEEAPFLKK